MTRAPSESPAVPGQAARGSITLTAGEHPQRGNGPFQRLRPHASSVATLLAGLAITIALSVSSGVSYHNNEHRLRALQTNLTASLLATAPVQVEALLARVAGLAAEAPAPVAAFRSAMASSMKPRGPFASSTLVVVKSGRVRVLAHLGAPPVVSLTARESVASFLKAAQGSGLVTSRVRTKTEQKLGYLSSARGPSGVFVVAVGQELPVALRVTVPPSSPDANLDFALYFGPKVAPASLIETNVSNPPLRGPVSKATVSFGNNVLTFVASPRRSLSGPWSEYLPWGILIGGVAISLGAAGLTERLARRRDYAASVAALNRRLYQDQRRAAADLQRSLLPKALPRAARLDIAARYVPSALGTAEVGGDWYGFIVVDDHTSSFVVGDVSGHGVEAAGAMASVRYTVRTLARLGMPPAEILARASEDLDTDDRFATALVGTVDTRRHEMVLASAGHLAPFLLQGGEGHFVSIDVGVPLGVPGEPPVPTTIDFGPGAVLIAFTDGLIERRGQPLAAGLERLAETAAAGPPQADLLLTHILTEITGTDHEDDIAMLAIRFL
ncbi:MAG TPA: PP2C family protein-serine/threonine phosphatase [Acidimicrobiales bacterium]|nr:PP2C family protein-serine/threonine phosphatase [Acidimicrobiales bacterium]